MRLSCSWGTIFLTSLFSAGSLSAGLLATCLSFSLPAEGHFLNKTPFRGESFCWVSDILFGLVSFLSGASLAVGVLIFSDGLQVSCWVTSLWFSLLSGKSFSLQIGLLIACLDFCVAAEEHVSP